RQHARHDRNLPLPNIPATFFENSLDCKIRCHVCPVYCAVSDASLDLGPHRHSLTRLRALRMERNRPFRPSKVNNRNYHQWDHLGPLEEQCLHDPNSSSGPRNKSAHCLAGGLFLDESGRCAALYAWRNTGELAHSRTWAIVCLCLAIPRSVRASTHPMGRSSVRTLSAAGQL